MKNISYISFQFLLIALWGCVEPFNPEVPNADSQFLVVEGNITNLQGPYSVRFSQTIGVDENEPHPISGINASIEEENGLIYSLSETSAGNYRTTDPGFVGIAGKRYRLVFTYNNQQYQSEWDLLQPSPPIDSVYYRPEIRGTNDPEVDLIGMQFYLDTHDEDEGARYYRWEWDEVWEIGVNFPAYYEYLGNDEIRLLSQQRDRCWKDDISRLINLNSSQGLAENKISNHKLAFVTNMDERLTRKYSVLVTQYALEEGEYIFWKNLKESNQDLGSLYDKQPARAFGNIKSVTETDELVLGYFSASGVSSTRVFVSAGEGPRDAIDPVFCQMDTIFKSSTSDEQVFAAIGRGQVFVNLLHEITSGAVIGYLMSSKRCTDCVYKGGNLAKPEYWE